MDEKLTPEVTSIRGAKLYTTAIGDRLYYTNRATDNVAIGHPTEVKRGSIAFLRAPWEDCKEICAPCMTDDEWAHYAGSKTTKELTRVIERYHELKEGKNDARKEKRVV